MSATPRSPGTKLLFALLSGALLAIPLFAMYLMVYDRQSHSETARGEIAQGWGGAQVLAGPVLVLPYEDQVTETVAENGHQVQRTSTVARELVVSPDIADIQTTVAPQRRRKSIYEAVVYEAEASGTERFSLPTDLARSGVRPDQLHLDRAELRVGLSDARGLVGRPPLLTVDGRPLRLQPGHGPSETGKSGFFGYLDASSIRAQSMSVAFRMGFRGNGALALAPAAGDTRWLMTSSWPSPSFGVGSSPSVMPIARTASLRCGASAISRSRVRWSPLSTRTRRIPSNTARPCRRASTWFRP